MMMDPCAGHPGYDLIFRRLGRLLGRSDVDVDAGAHLEAGHLAGTLQDLELYYDVGLAVANESGWPTWREGSEFRAIRDRSRAAVAAP